MNLGTRIEYTEPQVEDPAAQAVASFLQDTTGMLDCLLSRYMCDHSDARPSVSHGMGYGHGLQPGPVHPFHCSPDRSSIPYHADPHFNPQHWCSPRASESPIEGVGYADASTLGNGALAGVEKLAEGSSQAVLRLNRDIMKGFLEEMKSTVQEWSVKHNLLVRGVFEHADAPHVSSESTGPAVDLSKPVDEARQSEVPVSSVVLPHTADMVISVLSSLQQNETANMSEPAPQDNSKTRLELSSLQSQHRERKTSLNAARKSQHPQTKTSLGVPIGRVIADVANQLFHGDGVRAAGKVSGSDKKQSSEAGPVVAPQKQSSETGSMVAPYNETSLEIDGEAHVIFTTPTANGNAAPSFEFPNNEADQLKMALVTTCAPAVKRKKSAIERFHLRQPTEVVSSPDWLPPGWVTEVKTRGSGNSAGSKDKYYIDPMSKRRFRSRKEVFMFIETGSVDRPRKQNMLEPPPHVPDAEPVVMLEGGNAGQAAMATLTNLASANGPTAAPSTLVVADEAERPAKKQRGRPVGSQKMQSMSIAVSTAITPMATPSSFITTATATGHIPIPIPVLPSSVAALSGHIGSVYVPYGQPSDWAYESVATVPFPMCDPFYFTELNMQKVNGSKGFPTYPWFFTGPDTSWRPPAPVGNRQYVPSPGTLPKRQKRAPKKSPMGETSTLLNA